MSTIRRSSLDRREFVSAGLAATAVAATGLSAQGASAKPKGIAAHIARPPKGFSPLAAPGKVVRVQASGSFESIMQPNQMWPQPGKAKAMLERGMMELTGASNLVEAMGRIIHKDDTVAIKPNGIAGQDGFAMSSSFELILPIVEAVLAVGVPAERITVYEQFPKYLLGCRVNYGKNKLPKGVQSGTHNNIDCVMPAVRVYNGIGTRYCRFFTQATAVIEMPIVKDHSICGYTGALKNTTHGNINNPSKHHDHQASPQIAMLHNHPVVTSRVRLHIKEAFNAMYDGGPLNRKPQAQSKQGALYFSTDPVAIDTVGWQLVEKLRKENGLKSLKEAGREPRYIQTAGELGLGVADPNAIRLRSVTA